MSRLIFCFVVFGILSAALTCIAEEQPPRVSPETRSFMRAKLMQSQKILEGLTTENFDLVTKHAQEMSLLSLESQWNVLRTQQYVDQSAEFRHAIERMVAASKAKNLDAATLGYLDVTLKCIQCHQYVRDKGAREAIGMTQPPAIDGQLVDRSR